MPRFIVQQLKIDRMPGFPTGIPRTFKFSSNINIIHGANATGKSSIARAISNLFWHEHHDKYQLSSNYSIDEQQTGELNIGFGKMYFTGLGPLKEPEQLRQPKANMSLYALSLESMINEKETTIAQIILRESNGGFDLKKIISEKERPLMKITGNHPVLKNYHSAKQAFLQQVDEQSGLTDRSSEIIDLKEQIEAADQAALQVQRLKDIIAWADATEEWKSQQSAFGQYHPDHEKMNGTEATLIGHAIKRKNALEDEYKQEEYKYKQSIESIQALALPQDGVDLDKLSAIQQKIRQWDDTLSKIDEHRTKLNGLAHSRKGLLHIIGEDADPSRLEPVGEDLITELENLIGAQLDHHHKKDGRQEQIGLVDKQLNELGVPAYPASVIAPAKESIHRWLQAPQEEKPSISRKFLLGIGIALLVTILMVLFLGKWLVIFAVPILIALYYLGNQQNVPIPNEQRQFEINRLHQLGIQIPSLLTPQSMTNLLISLMEAERIHQTGSLLRARKDLFVEELKKINDAIFQTEMSMSDIKRRVTNFPEFPSTPSPTYILRFLQAWVNWQKHTNAMQEIEGQIEKLQQQATQKEGECREQLNQIGQPFTTDTALLQQQLESLRHRENERRSLVKECAQALSNIQTIEARIKKEATDIEAMLEQFSPENRTLASIEALQRNHDAYTEARNRLQAMERQVASMYQHLDVEAVPDLFDQGRLAVTRSALQEALRTSMEQAERRDGLIKALTELELLISQARKGQQLEALMAKRDMELANLDRLLNDHLDALGLKAVSEILIETTDTESRPEILNAAGTYFALFTHGRYRLFVTPDDEGKFIVSDDLTGRRQDLSELSAATKIQLVLAVRLAYISHIEKGLALPIMVDEVMMNSDERRAEEIMGILASISRERQVFYFTASQAERSHWQSVLERTDPPVGHMFISLEGTLEMPPAIEAPIENPFKTAGEGVPSSEGLTHHEYGLMIDPPGFHSIISSSDQLHVWYLVEDPSVVEGLLRMHIHNWRILLSIWNQKIDIPGMDQSSMEQYESMIQVLSDFQELYRKGRNKPINEEVLKVSGAISPTFFERVCELMKKHKGDPRALIQSIDDKQLKGFGTKSRNELYDYLVKNDYLSESAPYSDDEIKSRVLISVNKYGLDQAMMERFFDRVFQGDL